MSYTIIEKPFYPASEYEGVRRNIFTIKKHGSSILSMDVLVDNPDDVVRIFIGCGDFNIFSVSYESLILCGMVNRAKSRIDLRFFETIPIGAYPSEVMYIEVLTSLKSRTAVNLEIVYTYLLYNPFIITNPYRLANITTKRQTIVFINPEDADYHAVKSVTYNNHKGITAAFIICNMTNRAALITDQHEKLPLITAGKNTTIGRILTPNRKIMGIKFREPIDTTKTPYVWELEEVDDIITITFNICFLTSQNEQIISCIDWDDETGNIQREFIQSWMARELSNFLP
jgi:hypothetical protein